jgi:hypothetical protein
MKLFFSFFQHCRTNSIPVSGRRVRYGRGRHRPRHRPTLERIQRDQRALHPRPGSPGTQGKSRNDSSFEAFNTGQFRCIMQWKPLNVITLGLREIDNIIQMIRISE